MDRISGIANQGMLNKTPEERLKTLAGNLDRAYDHDYLNCFPNNIGKLEKVSCDEIRSKLAQNYDDCLFQPGDSFQTISEGKQAVKDFSKTVRQLPVNLIKADNDYSPDLEQVVKGAKNIEQFFNNGNFSAISYIRAENADAPYCHDILMGALPSGQTLGVIVACRS